MFAQSTQFHRPARHTNVAATGTSIRTACLPRSGPRSSLRDTLGFVARRAIGPGGSPSDFQNSRTLPTN